MPSRNLRADSLYWFPYQDLLHIWPLSCFPLGVSRSCSKSSNEGKVLIYQPLPEGKTRSYKRKLLLQHMQMLIKGERAGERLWKLTCISVESQMLLRCGKCFLMRSARSIYFSNSTTFISHALSPILTCMLSIGLGIHGLWLDQTKSSISDLELFATSWQSESSSRLNFVEDYSWLACQN